MSEYEIVPAKYPRADMMEKKDNGTIRLAIDIVARIEEAARVIQRDAGSAGEVSRLGEVLEWLTWLDEGERKVVLALAINMDWGKICWLMRCSKTTAWRTWSDAILKIKFRTEEAGYER